MQYIWLAGEMDGVWIFFQGKKKSQPSSQVRGQSWDFPVQDVSRMTKSFLRAGGKRQGLTATCHALHMAGIWGGWVFLVLTQHYKEERWDGQAGMFPGLLAVLTGMAWGHSSLLVLDRNLGKWNTVIIWILVCSSGIGGRPEFAADSRRIISLS